jgi:hypothetical protein
VHWDAFSSKIHSNFELSIQMDSRIACYQAKMGGKVVVVNKELCRKHNWKAKSGGLEGFEAARLQGWKARIPS